jgi:hypothetical protein
LAGRLTGGSLPGAFSEGGHGGHEREMIFPMSGTFASGFP